MGATGTTAALAATYAKQVGRAVAFSLAAFRQAFAGGHDLDLESTVLLAGAACELHPRALLQAISRPAIGAALQHACDRARRAGVRSLPAIEVRGSLFSGDDAVEQAAEIMKQPGGPPSPGHVSGNGTQQVGRGPLSDWETCATHE
jgi:2-hydroxychromene-2-carboxylate isomerase